MDSVPRDTIWHWLALGQHHRLPTRLLDWTFSPYVALHFVTNELALADRDGAVWCIDYVRVHEELPAELRASLEREGADVLTTEMLDGVVTELEALERHGDFVAFVEPPSFDARIVNQVRDKLDAANVNERVLFPGLDGLSSWLKRSYLPRESP